MLTWQLCRSVLHSVYLCVCVCYIFVASFCHFCIVLSFSLSHQSLTLPTVNSTFIVAPSFPQCMCVSVCVCVCVCACMRVRTISAFGFMSSLDSQTLRATQTHTHTQRHRQIPFSLIYIWVRSRLAAFLTVSFFFLLCQLSNFELIALFGLHFKYLTLILQLM